MQKGMLMTQRMTSLIKEAVSLLGNSRHMGAPQMILVLSLLAISLRLKSDINEQFIGEEIIHHLLIMVYDVDIDKLHWCVQCSFTQ